MRGPQPPQLCGHLQVQAPGAAMPLWGVWEVIEGLGGDMGDNRSEENRGQVLP